MIYTILLFFVFLYKSRQKLEPHYCTNMYEHVNEDITKYNVTRPKTSLEKLLAFKRKIRYANYGGFDDRNITEDDSIHQIAENMRKYKLLKLLENEAIGELPKLDAIEEWQKIDGKSSIASDLTKGGLFRDWEWDF